MTEEAAVSVRDLTVVYGTDRGEMPALRDVSLDLPRHRITGVVGESGSGKSTLALAVVNGLPAAARRTRGSVRVAGAGEISHLRGAALRHVRGHQLGFVLQASQNSLNPVRRIGKQVLDLGRSHGVGREALRSATELAQQMGLDPRRVLAAYPHELSGGMRQRVALIFALCLDTSTLILDEPTTALDMISQAAVLQIVRELHRRRGLSTVLITHDLSVVAEVADRVVVMYGGRVVEEGPTSQVMRNPAHPYTRGLLRAIPRLSGDVGEARPLPGTPPDLATIPREGCVFRDRCPLRVPVCDQLSPRLEPLGEGHRAACHVTAAPR